MSSAHDEDVFQDEDDDLGEVDLAGIDVGRKSGSSAKRPSPDNTTKTVVNKKKRKSLFDLDDDDENEEDKAGAAQVEVKEEPAEEVDVKPCASSSKSSLTAAQKARAEKNRLKALSLKHARLLARGPRDGDGSSNKVVVDTLTGDKKEIGKEKKVLTSL